MPGWAIIRPEEKTMEGDLYLPESSSGTLQRGEVVAVDPVTVSHGTTVTYPVAVGDTVAFKRYHDQDLESEGTTYKAVQVEHLICRI